MRYSFQHSSWRARVLATLCLIASAQAYEWDITLPSRNLTVGEQFTVSNLTKSSDRTKELRIYLYTSVAQLDLCLLKVLPTYTTTFNITLPPSIGPSGFYYRIAASNYGTYPNSPDLDYVPSFGILYSGLFFATNPRLSPHSSEYTDYEKHGGHPLLSARKLDYPCSSLDCIRECIIKGPAPVYDDGWGSSSGGGINHGGTTFDSAYLDCLHGCDGVDFKNEWLTQEPRYVSITTATATGRATSTATSAATVTRSELWMVEPSSSSKSLVEAVCPTAGADRYNTPCGKECCGPSEYCFYWGNCMDFGSSNDEPKETFKVTVGPHATAMSGYNLFGLPLETATATTTSGSREGETQARRSSEPSAAESSGAIKGSIEMGLLAGAIVMISAVGTSFHRTVWDIIEEVMEAVK